MSTDMKQIYPWLEQSYDDLEQSYLQQQLHHAILLTGSAHIGRFALCRSLAAMLLCTAAKPPKPCGQCSGCRLLKAGSHPDYIILGADSKDRTIAIEQVRQLIAELEKKPHQGCNRVIVFHEVHRLNKSAANALLKSLEEPPLDTYMLLTSSRPYRLPATIRSRLLVHPLPVPALDKAIPWLTETGNMPRNQAELLLAQAHGAPLLALTYQNGEYQEIRNTLQLAIDHFRFGTGSLSIVLDSLDKHASIDVFLLLDTWLCAMIRYALTDQQSSLAHSDMADWMTKMRQGFHCKAAFVLRDKIWRFIQMIESQINPNAPLLYVDCFLSLKSLWPQR